MQRIFFIFILFNLNAALLIAENKLDVIVLDAGHGGRDPGAIGISGVYEKNINLAITLKLGAIISNYYPYMKIIYTRTDDSFPDLRYRTEIANANNAKLFISIHANHKKTEENDKSGFEIYVLNRERFQEAVRITESDNQMIPRFTNSVDDTSRYILNTLAHHSYLKYAYNLSYNLELKYASIDVIPSRGIRDADFWVLAGASMPSVLVECGYVSNEYDENKLTNNDVQFKIAMALFEGFRNYKLYYEM